MEQIGIAFDSWEDLQTRTVLLPRVEEDGIGAKVFSYDSTRFHQSSENEDLSQLAATSPLPSSIEGYEVLEIQSEGQALSESVHKLDFASILAAIRQASPPFVLILGPSAQSLHSSDSRDSETKIFEEKKEDTDPYLLVPESSLEQMDQDQGTTSSHSFEQSVLDAPSATALPYSSRPPTHSSSGSTGSLLSELSSTFWSPTTRAKATSFLELAKERATGVAASTSHRLSVNATPVALNLPANNSTLDSITHKQDKKPWINDPRATLYLHSSLGTWISKNATTGSFMAKGMTGNLLPSPPASASDLTVTNTSVVMIRSSESSPLKDFVRFQWYRSEGKVSSSISTESAGETRSIDTVESSMTRWTLMKGATHAAFQPTSCEIGHRLRCLVTLPSQSCSSDTDSEGEEDLTLETLDVVRAAIPLLNGSRQALVRTAQFSGLAGQGKLEGRCLLLKVCVGMTETTRRVTSAVTIYQVSGEVAEPMHDESSPILGVSACIPNYTNVKGIELIFTRSLPESASMVQALATGNCFELQAPNRISRESLLLALGVANFCGKPSDLNDTTILYSSPSPAPASLIDDDKTISRQSSSSESSHPSLKPSSLSNASIMSSSDNEIIQMPFTTTSTLHAEPAGSSMSTLRRPPLANTHVPATASVHKRCFSLDGTPAEIDCDDVATQLIIHELEDELQSVREMVIRKSKVIAELQRNIALTESSFSTNEKRIRELELSLRQQEKEQENLLQSKRLVEKQLSQQDEIIGRLKTDLATKIADTASQISSKANTIAELQKIVRSLENDKAVLSAAVEARESKLDKMESLQRSVDIASEKAKENESLHKKIDDIMRRYMAKCSELELCVDQLALAQSDLVQIRSDLEALSALRQKDQAIIDLHKSEHDKHQIKIQVLMAERNSYKQKSESLSKEMARICKNGRSIRVIEKIIAEDASRCQEVLVLREQKQKLTDELQNYQILYEQARRVQLMAGVDYDTIKVTERNVELERLVSELTEYVTAKEMQLETFKLVNDALQLEIRSLAKANMSKDEV